MESGVLVMINFGTIFVISVLQIMCFLLGKTIYVKCGAEQRKVLTHPCRNNHRDSTDIMSKVRVAKTYRNNVK
jgi:hypothetical protein